MGVCDFVVDYDPKKDTSEDITERILYSIFICRLKAKKPVVIFMGGDSGEGKSFSALKLQEVLMKMQGLKLQDYLDAVNIYTPLQYGEKVDKLLYDKELKKANILCFHEAREVVKAKNWQSFLSQSVADINAMSRTLKRMCVIIVSQFIRDITNDMRYTLNFYCTVRRPRNKRARLFINVLWKDDRDLEKPKLRKRRLSGYLRLPNGRFKKYVPQYLELSKPSPDIVERFEKSDYDAKASIIRNKLNRLIAEMKADAGEQNNKVTMMVEWYTKNIDNLNLIGKRYRGKWKVKKEVQEMHDLNSDELKMFEIKLNETLKEKGVFEVGE
jgi:hypothetical protein